MRLIDADALQKEYKARHEGKRLLLIDVAPSIEPEQQWTPCGERLPDADGVYIVDDRRFGKWIHTAGYRKNSNSWCELHGVYYDDHYGRYDDQDKIIAWMPLPEPYKQV